MGSQQLFLILRARWKFAVQVFAAVLVLVVLVTLILPDTYLATVSVVVQGKADPVANLAYPTTLMPSDIATQADIIGSHRVALRVVKVLKLDESPYFKEQYRRHGSGDMSGWIADELLKDVTVTPSKESDVINISVKWKDPELAATLANTWAQAYIDTNIELKVDSAKQYAAWFNEQSRILRADLEAKQKRLADFQKAAGILPTSDKLDVENARLQELTTQLVAVETQRQESVSRERQAGTDTQSLPEVLQNPVIANLKAQLALTEAKRRDMALNYGKNYPDYKDVEAEEAGLRERIAQESARIAASLGTTAQVDVRRENDLKAAVDAQKKRILELMQQHDQVADLQNDVSMAQKNLDAVTQRLAQSSLESQAQQTNVALLTLATPPIRPYSPKLALNCLFGLFLGIVCGIGAALLKEMSDRRVRESDELAQLLGVPILGRIPNTRPRGGGAARPYPEPAAGRT